MSAYGDDYPLPVGLLDCDCCWQVLLTDGRVAKVGPGQAGGFVACSDGVNPDGPGFNTADEAFRSLVEANEVLAALDTSAG